MPRIRLSYWLGDLHPGDELEVTADELAALKRDGRVAEVLDDQPADTAPAAEAQPEHGPEAVDAAQPEPAPEAADGASSGRKRR